MDKTKLERLELLEKAMERLGDFGKLFVDYKGCPRGQKGENAHVPGMRQKNILLKEDPIIDVEGDVWIPVLARDLYRYINRDLWVPVTERLPENGYSVLVTSGKGHRPIIARYSRACNAWRVPCGLRITHWMPLPEPPKEGA